MKLNITMIVKLLIDDKSMGYKDVKRQSLKRIDYKTHPYP